MFSARKRRQELPTEANPQDRFVCVAEAPHQVRENGKIRIFGVVNGALLAPRTTRASCPWIRRARLRSARTEPFERGVHLAQSRSECARCVFSMFSTMATRITSTPRRDDMRRRTPHVRSLIKAAAICSARLIRQCHGAAGPRSEEQRNR